VGTVVLVGVTLFMLTGRPTSNAAGGPQRSAAQLQSDALWWESSARLSGGDFNRLGRAGPKTRRRVGRRP
jgi:hypothetical protein